METAYSYIRFSSKKQEEGDSIRRQTELTAEWATRKGIALDTSLKPDRGISAFRGRNQDIGALGAFLALVDAGKVSRGSYLVVESLDRLTREEIQPALLLVLQMLQRGIRLVQLKPVETVYDSRSDTTPIILMLVELSRGHSESKVKSERVSAAWGERRKLAAAGTQILTHKLPAWVEDRGGKLVEIPERAAVVRRIFALSIEGLGTFAIMARLRAENVPAWGPSGRWSITYIWLILRDRRAVGEFTPKARDQTPAPIPNYFPAVVSENDWQLARAGASQRLGRREWGRIGTRVNLFQGLLKGARDGLAYTVVPAYGRHPEPVYKSSGHRMGNGHYGSFPCNSLEGAILSALREVDPREITGQKVPDDETATLAAELARAEASIVAITADMEQHGESPALFRRLREKEADAGRLKAKLAEARQRAARPLADSWDESRSLIAALAQAPDPREARLRLRGALRRIVDEIRLLVVAAGRTRVAFVQLWLTGGGSRVYAVVHAAAVKAGKRTPRRPSSWETKRFECGDDFDLRTPAGIASATASANVTLEQR